jgi:hypothetical protein
LFLRSMILHNDPYSVSAFWKEVEGNSMIFWRKRRFMLTEEDDAIGHTAAKYPVIFSFLIFQTYLHA